MIFNFKTAQNLIAEHYERDFDSIFQFKTTQKRGSDHYERDFYMNCYFNPFPHSVPIWQRLAKLSILILEGTIKKNSYERREHESVDEKSLS